MKLRHCIVGLATAAALSLGITGSAVAGGTPAFTQLVNGVFWSSGHTRNNSSDLWLRTGQLTC